LPTLEKFEADLWKIADDLRANSAWRPTYISCHHGGALPAQATNRYYEALAAIDADKKAGKMPDRPPVAATSPAAGR
jgi:type I restriction enzyme M protein